ncbi:cellulose biosynthesis protein BcsQ [Streptomyces sp. V4I23]|nr:cellulose biosynthesis protein BcsQ [Streptomyces sp. V4I23]
MLIANISPRSMGKTTDTGMMGHAFHEAGYRVQLWDADESEHLTQWSELAAFPFPVKHNASAKFAEEYTPLGEAGIDIVDVGHTENHPHIADSVLKVADLVLIHMEPSMADYQRVHQPRTSTPVKTMVGRSAFDRPSRTAPPMWVLLNRVRPQRSEREGDPGPAHRRRLQRAHGEDPGPGRHQAGHRLPGGARGSGALR